MKNIDITPIIEALIALLSAFITLFILPKVKSYLAEKLSAEQRENLKQWVKVAVAAAEQIYNKRGLGEQKKEYVVSFLLSKGFVFDMDEVTALIESEVYKLSQGSGYILKDPEGDAALSGEKDNAREISETAEETEEDSADEEDNTFLTRNVCN